VCVLSLQEFLTATVFLGKLQRRENLMAAFQHFDNDDSGFISEEELLQVSVGCVLQWRWGTAVLVPKQQAADSSVLCGVVCLQALQQEGVSQEAIESILEDCDRDNDR
jgi:Ca2+-binding EF-hand superfamily protein